MGRRVDAGKRSTILRREGLPLPASAARTVEGPLAVGGKNYGVGVGRTPFPDQPRGSRPLAGFRGRQDLARAKWNPGGKRSGRQAVLAARRYSPPRRIAPPRQDWRTPLQSQPLGCRNLLPPRVRTPGAMECSNVRPLEVPALSLPGNLRGWGTTPLTQPENKRRGHLKLRPHPQ